MTIRDNRKLGNRRHEPSDVVAENYLAQRQINRMRKMEDAPDALYPIIAGTDYTSGSDNENENNNDVFAEPTIVEMDDLLNLFERKVLETQSEGPESTGQFSLNEMDYDYQCLHRNVEDGSGPRSPMVISLGSSSSASVSMCSDEPLRRQTNVGDAVLLPRLAPDV